MAMKVYLPLQSATFHLVCESDLPDLEDEVEGWTVHMLCDTWSEREENLDELQGAIPVRVPTRLCCVCAQALANRGGDLTAYPSEDRLPPSEKIVMREKVFPPQEYVLYHLVEVKGLNAYESRRMVETLCGCSIFLDQIQENVPPWVPVGLCRECEDVREARLRTCSAKVRPEPESSVK